MRIHSSTLGQNSFKKSLVVLSLTAALAACGGGGGDAAPAAVTPSPAPAPAPATPAPTAPTTTGPTQPTASTGTSSGTASDTVGTITLGLPPAPTVQTANQVLTDLPLASYSASSQVANAWGSVQDWRSRVRTEEEGAFGVGFLTQSPPLDLLAAQVAASSPSLTSSDATERQTALTNATQLMTTAGYPVSIIAGSTTTNTYGVGPGPFCAKSLFSALPGVELLTSGMRFGGMSVPEGDGPCVLVAGLTSAASWQLPPTGSSSVYPFPGKQLTLTRYFGEYASLGFASQPGHAVFVSVASVDALPFAVPGAGSGAAIAPSAITLKGFTLVERDAGTAVAATILVPTGMARDAGVTAVDTSSFRFPTSIALVPLQPLKINTAYRASFSATVNRRVVVRTWEFTTAEN